MAYIRKPRRNRGESDYTLKILGADFAISAGSTWRLNVETRRRCSSLNRDEVKKGWNLLLTRWFFAGEDRRNSPPKDDYVAEGGPRGKIGEGKVKFGWLRVRFIELEQQAAIRHNSIISFFYVRAPPSIFLALPLSLHTLDCLRYTRVQDDSKKSDIYHRERRTIVSLFFFSDEFSFNSFSLGLLVLSLHVDSNYLNSEFQVVLIDDSTSDKW